MVPRRSISVAVPFTLALALGLTLGAPSATAQQTSPGSTLRVQEDPRPGDLPAGSLITDGSIFDLVHAGDRIYAVGAFGRIGRYQGAGDRLDATGAQLASPQLADGQISVEVSDGAGGWYLGGDFSGIGGKASGGLAHVLADGSLDPAFLPKTNGLVSAIALVGGTLYVGGDFTKVGSASRAGLAAVSVADGSVLPFDAPQSRRVTELEAGPTALYVGTEDHLSAVNLLTGATLPAFTSTSAEEVHALTLGGGHLYVGTHKLVALDPTTGAVDATFNAGAAQSGRYYHSLLWTDGGLYVGSDRTDRLQVLDPETGAVDPTFNAHFAGSNGTFGGPGGVYDLALDGSHLWVAGSFTSAGGVATDGLAVLDATSGTRVDVSTPKYDKQVNAVELSGGAVFVGGTFAMSDWMRTRNIAALDATTLEPLRGFHMSERPYGDLTIGSDALYMASNHFEGYDSYDVNHPYYNYTSSVRAFDPDSGAALPKLSLKVSNLSGITTIGDRLYVAQRLDNDIKFPRNRITVYDARGKKVRSFQVPLLGYVSTLSSVGGDLLLGGSFKRKSANGGLRNTALLRVDATNGDRRPYFDPHIHGPVYDLAVQGSSVFANGLFQKVFEGPTAVNSRGITKMSSRSTRDDQFSTPSKFNGAGYSTRIHALGSLLWFDSYRGRFLDIDSGEFVPSPVPERHPSAVTTAPGGYAYGSNIYTNLNGQDFLPLGVIAKTS
ncbi:hypothetical protein ABLE68_13750 [Nocardioides sp. CN2-186]|uniref:hypothetical protein n=1 Tax=Nocardioides tweenelious TaxID=3156607 RepID=UPI0032B56CD4